MAEAEEESAHVWSHKARIALFLSAMRHFRDSLRERGLPVIYHELDRSGNRGSLASALDASVRQLRPGKLIVAEPGEHRVRQALAERARDLGLKLEVRPDRHFLCSAEEFQDFLGSRKQPRMEHFYRRMRRKTGVLMEGEAPAGGRWNFDADNRKPFGRDGPGPVPRPRGFAPDRTTKEVLDLVRRRFGEHPGSLDSFDWPVTPGQAQEALADFVRNRLHGFGPTQDAMWTGMPVLYHSRLSCALNLKLLDPRQAIARAEEAYRRTEAPIASVEGFVRQVLGWREYVRGIYQASMPAYAARNFLEASLPLPAFFWTGQTPWNCLRETLRQTLEHAYAHHIQRLMVTGLFCLLCGVDPRGVHRWYLAVYVDAVEWVELPNTLGMSQFADGGLMASKPYAATGKYIQRMSNYCGGCPCDPSAATGERACPFTLLYWDFLLRKESVLAGVPRMRLQLRNLARLTASRRRRVRAQAEALRRKVCC